MAGLRCCFYTTERCCFGSIRKREVMTLPWSFLSLPPCLLASAGFRREGDMPRSRTFALSSTGNQATPSTTTG
ncbi:hypothetical protein MUK42_36977 [Musa troglodytarum]|uniref:Uncharacterized protein n=1 Tax=Musa troglodytarum TaxID=320322 RepID=A0A9E7EEQ8_9LILI|nr:hypothetical protein MUK42_36977 [Musa troglodytarum]